MSNDLDGFGAWCFDQHIVMTLFVVPIIMAIDHVIALVIDHHDVGFTRQDLQMSAMRRRHNRVMVVGVSVKQASSHDIVPALPNELGVNLGQLMVAIVFMHCGGFYFVGDGLLALGQAAQEDEYREGDFNPG
ncbi:hypothetical protein NBRC116587_00490 [Pseudoteredinibacter isoporae]